MKLKNSSPTAYRDSLVDCPPSSHFLRGQVVVRARTPDPSSRLPLVEEATANVDTFLALCDRHELLTPGTREEDGGSEDADLEGSSRVDYSLDQKAASHSERPVGMCNRGL